MYIEKLKQELAKAVAEERYEDAGRLVEEIRRLGSSQGTDGAHGQ